MRNELRDLVKKNFNEKVNNPKTFKGNLGNRNGVVAVPGMTDYVYVTLLDGSVTTAYNTSVPLVLNLPVVIGYDMNQASSKLLKVLSIRDLRAGTGHTSTNTVLSHHASHEWLNKDGGNDIVYVELRQFMPLRPAPTSPMSISINRGMLNIGGAWKYIESQTISVADYVPSVASGSSGTYNPYVTGSAIQAKFVLISIDYASGSAVVTDGSSKSIYELRITDIPATPTGDYPICAVRLYNYQTQIVEAGTQTDIVDLRWGMFTNGQVSTGQVPKTISPVEGYYLTGYDSNSGSFSSGSVLATGASGSHNDLTGLQGGMTDEYYHLTGEQHTIATQASGSGQDGYLKKEDYSEFKLLATVARGAWNLYELHDVNIGAQTDGQALVYDAGTDKWIPGSVSSGSGGSSGSQVVPVSHVPVENFYLTGYDATSGSWASGSVVGGTSGSGGIPEAPVDGKTYGRKNAGWTEIVSGSGGSSGSGASTFLELTDTPSSYSGQAGKVVTVNSEGTGLVFTSLEALLAIGFFLVDTYVSDGDSPV